jgi:hypothetical protein
MLGFKQINTVATVTRLSTDPTIGDVDVQFSIAGESQLFIYAANAKDAGDALAAGNYFRAPTPQKWSWTVNPYFVWVASLTTAGIVFYRWE